MFCYRNYQCLNRVFKTSVFIFVASVVVQSAIIVEKKSNAVLKLSENSVEYERVPQPVQRRKREIFNNEKRINITDVHNDLRRREGAADMEYLVVWATTKEVGCARTVCPTLLDKSSNVVMTNAHLLVCNYGPTGNWMGEKPFLVGQPCSKCHSGNFWCDKGLCRADCSTDISTCECGADCRNCGKINNKCSCDCLRGWWGADCSDPCVDTNAYCGASPGWPADMCDDTNYAIMLKECPALCGVCQVEPSPAAAVCPDTPQLNSRSKPRARSDDTDPSTVSNTLTNNQTEGYQNVHHSESAPLTTVDTSDTPVTESSPGGRTDTTVAFDSMISPAEDAVTALEYPATDANFTWDDSEIGTIPDEGDSDKHSFSSESPIFNADPSSKFADSTSESVQATFTTRSTSDSKGSQGTSGTDEEITTDNVSFRSHSTESEQDITTVSSKPTVPFSNSTRSYSDTTDMTQTFAITSPKTYSAGHDITTDPNSAQHTFHTTGKDIASPTSQETVSRTTEMGGEFADSTSESVQAAFTTRSTSDSKGSQDTVTTQGTSGTDEEITTDSNSTRSYSDTTDMTQNYAITSPKTYSAGHDITTEPNSSQHTFHPTDKDISSPTSQETVSRTTETGGDQMTSLSDWVYPVVGTLSVALALALAALIAIGCYWYQRKRRSIDLKHPLPNNNKIPVSRYRVTVQDRKESVV